MTSPVIVIEDDSILRLLQVAGRENELADMADVLDNIARALG